MAGLMVCDIIAEMTSCQQVELHACCLWQMAVTNHLHDISTGIY